MLKYRDILGKGDKFIKNIEAVDHEYTRFHSSRIHPAYVAKASPENPGSAAILLAGKRSCWLADSFIESKPPRQAASGSVFFRRSGTGKEIR